MTLSLPVFLPCLAFILFVLFLAVGHLLFVGQDRKIWGWGGEGVYPFIYLFACYYNLIHKLASKEEASYTLTGFS